MKLAFFIGAFLVLSGKEIHADESITIYKHRSVNQTLGPENAIYCLLIDPRGNTVYDGFGKCNLVIERVSMAHHGEWKMSVGLPEHIILNAQRLTVTVREEEEKPAVITFVQKQRPEVLISCSVSSPYPIKACKFRGPNGNILIAAPGIGQDRYVYYGTEVGLESEISPHECGLRITNPLTSDLGLWRCSMETAYETYFGFLPVLCPWALQDPNVQAIVTTEPTLTSAHTTIEAHEGDSLTMSCSIQAPIRYCYFRRQNGTTFSVSPGTSTPNMEYVGAGFDAGECGVRFNSMLASDAGTWSCAVGLYNNTQAEQRVSFTVNIDELMTVRHYYNAMGHLALEGQVRAAGTLEYCRYVRMDGFGFTSLNVPEGFSFSGSHSTQSCSLLIDEPTILNLHPWAIAAKIRGMDEEISRTTTDSLLRFEPTPESSGPHHPWYFWVVIAIIAVLLVFTGAACGPKKNRQWTFARATILRDSVRNSLRKEPLPPQAPISPVYQQQPAQQQTV